MHLLSLDMKLLWLNNPIVSSMEKIKCARHLGSYGTMVRQEQMVEYRNKTKVYGRMIQYQGEESCEALMRQSKQMKNVDSSKESFRTL